MCKKAPPFPRRKYSYSPPLKYQKRPALWSYNSSKFISAPLILERDLIPCIIVYPPDPRKPEYGVFQKLLQTVECHLDNN